MTFFSLVRLLMFYLQSFFFCSLLCSQAESPQQIAVFWRTKYQSIRKIKINKYLLNLIISVFLVCFAATVNIILLSYNIISLCVKCLVYCNCLYHRRIVKKDSIKWAERNENVIERGLTNAKQCHYQCQ